MPSPCHNLRQLFGDRFQIEYDEAYYAEHGPNARADDPWLQIIPCRNGHICPWGRGTIAACTRSAGPVVKALMRLQGAAMQQNGSDGANIVFPVEMFDRVADIMHPRKRRRLSLEARAAAIERLAKYQFSPAAHASENERPCGRNGKAG